MIEKFIRLMMIFFCFFITFSHAQLDFLLQLKQKTNQILSLFSPRDNLKLYLHELIQQETKSIQIAAYNITSQDIVEQLIQAKKRNVKVEVITGIEGLQCNGERITQLWRADIPIYVVPSSTPSMHHKYIIFSQNKVSNLKAVVWTGSGNITERGLTRNYENIIILSGIKTIQNYQKDFDWLKKKIQQQPQAIFKVITQCGNRKTTPVVHLVQGMISLIK